MNTPSLGVWLVGASGRMGQAIQRVADEAGDIHFCGSIGSRGADRSVEEHGYPVVVIDFSAPQGTCVACDFAATHGYPLVSGTTGLDAAHEERFQQLAQYNAVLHANNMSAGVHVLAALVQQAATTLRDWDTEIVELHHRMKKDSPSGTALLLARAADAGHGVQGEAHWRRSRDGIVGARSAGELGIFGVRGGDVVGEHTAFLFGSGERLELTHRATDRTIFARGALRAARWLTGRAAGRYHMTDVLGL
ncbi:MAG: 4-hydroxy-tetrahydrodipicolinate reductase [Myxococcales bacterium]|nr:4-hydroxy-tetrahydrodipicolinate reductase [Myxococcales bacterium]